MSINNKLLTIQQQIEAVKKEGENPHFRSSYVTLDTLIEAVKPIINKEKCIILQPMRIIDGWMHVETQIIDTETGETVTSTMKLPELMDPQKIGSAITYYRRYTLQSLLFIGAEDDDGNNLIQTITPVVRENRTTAPPNRPQQVMQAQQQPTGKAPNMVCPSCNEGVIVEKKNKAGGTFWSCDRFPKCRQSYSTKEDAEFDIIPF